MSRHGTVTRPFGTKEHTFRLGIDQWREVQKVCDAGPGEIAARLAPLMRLAGDRAAGGNMMQLVLGGALGRWRIDDIRAPLLFGLVGGGMAPTMATATVMAVFDQESPLVHAALAFEVVMAGLLGSEGEPPPGEKTGRARKARSRRSPEASSASTPS